MLVLGIETSGVNGSVALYRDDACLGERRLNQFGQRHAAALVLEIYDLLKDCCLKPQDVELVAVSRGPGSFTGLRVGMVCAKTFAYATKCRFIAVDTFLAIATNTAADFHRLFIIENGQRDELFVGEYRRIESLSWSQVSPIQIMSIEAFCRDRTSSDVITGPGLYRLDPNQIQSKFLTEETILRPHASVIARLGRLLIATSGTESNTQETDFWKASPFYLRQSAAEEKYDSMNAKGGP